ncbi:MAG: universal stress protein [Polyangiaceae bacterium]|nr:universal stress protein [Polyangiaceae bacterium]
MRANIWLGNLRASAGGGTQGRRGLAHALLGSVTERVLRSAPVSVLTVSAEALVQAERRANAQAADMPPC